MTGLSELKAILGESLFWNKARLDCFARMLLAMIAAVGLSMQSIHRLW